jgi:hypothetical protein
MKTAVGVKESGIIGPVTVGEGPGDDRGEHMVKRRLMKLRGIIHLSDWETSFVN